MLQLVLGRAGSGKSYSAQNWLAEQAAQGKRNMMLLVPEQFTFESERALLHRLHASPAGQIEVLSFSRLATRVFQQTGGMAGRLLDDAGRLVLMSLAVDAVRDRLQVYGRLSTTPGFLDEMLGIVKEWKQCAIDGESLQNVILRLEEGPLRRKMKDLALIYEAYQAQVNTRYVDPADELDRLYDKLQGGSFFSGKTVVVDSFKGFTGQQKKILEHIIAAADTVRVTLCCDSLEDTQHKLGLFSNVIATANELIDMANRHAVKTLTAEYLKVIHRFDCSALRTLEAGLFAPAQESDETPTDRVTVMEAATRYEEAEAVARTIRRLVREQGIRYRDIAVISRDDSSYAALLRAAFSRYGIPCFLDARAPVASQPLMRFVLAVLEAAGNRLDTDAILSALKTGLTGLSLERVSALENYCLIWNIRGNQWLQPWHSDPDGVTDRPAEDAAARLEQLNADRRIIAEPLSRFVSAVSRPQSARRMAGALFRLLEEFRAADGLRRLGAEWEALGLQEDADLQYQTWDLCVHMLDQIVDAWGDAPLDFERFSTLLQRMISLLDLGSVPQGVDEVTVGMAERMRPAHPQVVFLVGCNEEVFPAYPASGGLLSDAERTRLIQEELPVVDRCETAVVEEKFLAYQAACAASSQLFVSYSRSTPGQHASDSSELVRQINKLLPHCQRLTDQGPDELDAVEAPLPSLEVAARLWRRPTAVWDGLRQVLPELDGTASLWNGLTRAALPAAPALKPETARALYGQNMLFSTYAMQDHAACRFQFLCKYGLRLRGTPRPAVMDNVERGSLTHLVLQTMLESYGSHGLTQLDKSCIREDVRRQIDAYICERMGGYEDKSDRFRYQLRQIEDLLVSLVKHIADEMAQTSFVTRYCELPIRMDTAVKPLRIDLPNDGTLSISGTIDRVDVLEEEGASFYRVVDYKSSVHSVNLEDIQQGLGIQMLLYLFTLKENGQELLPVNCQPAGVLYATVQQPEKLAASASAGEYNNEDDETTGESGETRLVTSGLLLQDTAVLHAMEPAGKRRFIPVAFTKSGAPNMQFKHYLATMATFGHLQRQIHTLLTDMGISLQNGRSDADPLDGIGTGDPCGYCAFRSACPRSDQAEHRRVIRWSTEERDQIVKSWETENGQGGE